MFQCWPRCPLLQHKPLAGSDSGEPLKHQPGDIIVFNSIRLRFLWPLVSKGDPVPINTCKSTLNVKMGVSDTPSVNRQLAYIFLLDEKATHEVTDPGPVTTASGLCSFSHFRRYCNIFMSPGSFSAFNSPSTIWLHPTTAVTPPCIETAPVHPPSSAPQPPRRLFKNRQVEGEREVSGWVCHDHFCLLGKNLLLCLLWIHYYCIFLVDTRLTDSVLFTCSKRDS